VTNALVTKVLDLYGGRALWSKAGFIKAEISTRGLAFVLKQRPRFHRARLFMQVARPYCTITPIGVRSGISGVLEGADVRLEDPQGRIIAHREKARDFFPSVRRLFYWDDLDMSYFANYAFWNYFTFPALLVNKEIAWEQKSDETLEAIFPDSIPTHSRIQYFHFDTASGFLSRHDYTAEIISRHASAAHVILKHDKRNGIPFPSLRRVTPRVGKGRILAHPVLIEIKVHDFTLMDSHYKTMSA